MGDGARLAIAILILFLAMVAFFFAFHPGGVALDGKEVKNPGDILKFMFAEFDKGAGVSSTDTGNANPAPGATTQPPTQLGSDVSPIANVPGSNTSMIKLVGPNVSPIANLP